MLLNLAPKAWRHVFALPMFLLLSACGIEQIELTHVITPSQPVAAHQSIEVEFHFNAQGNAGQSARNDRTRIIVQVPVHWQVHAGYLGNPERDKIQGEFQDMAEPVEVPPGFTPQAGMRLVAFQNTYQGSQNGYPFASRGRLLVTPGVTRNAAGEVTGIQTGAANIKALLALLQEDGSFRAVSPANLANGDFAQVPLPTQTVSADLIFSGEVLSGGGHVTEVSPEIHFSLLNYTGSTESSGHLIFTVPAQQALPNQTGYRIFAGPTAGSVSASALPVDTVSVSRYPGAIRAVVRTKAGDGAYYFDVPAQNGEQIAVNFGGIQQARYIAAVPLTAQTEAPVSFGFSGEYRIQQASFLDVVSVPQQTLALNQPAVIEFSNSHDKHTFYPLIFQVPATWRVLNGEALAGVPDNPAWRQMQEIDVPPNLKVENSPQPMQLLAFKSDFGGGTRFRLTVVPSAAADGVNIETSARNIKALAFYQQADDYVFVSPGVLHDGDFANLALPATQPSVNLLSAGTVFNQGAVPLTVLPGLPGELAGKTLSLATNSALFKLPARENLPNQYGYRVFVSDSSDFGGSSVSASPVVDYNGTVFASVSGGDALRYYVDVPVKPGQVLGVEAVYPHFPLYVAAIPLVTQNAAPATLAGSQANYFPASSNVHRIISPPTPLAANETAVLDFEIFGTFGFDYDEQTLIMQVPENWLVSALHLYDSRLNPDPADAVLLQETSVPAGLHAQQDLPQRMRLLAFKVRQGPDSYTKGRLFFTPALEVVNGQVQGINTYAENIKIVLGRVLSSGVFEPMIEGGDFANVSLPVTAVSSNLSYSGEVLNGSGKQVNVIPQALESPPQAYVGTFFNAGHSEFILPAQQNLPNQYAYRLFLGHSPNFEAVPLPINPLPNSYAYALASSDQSVRLRLDAGFINPAGNYYLDIPVTSGKQVGVWLQNNLVWSHMAAVPLVWQEQAPTSILGAALYQGAEGETVQSMLSLPPGQIAGEGGMDVEFYFERTYYNRTPPLVRHHFTIEAGKNSVSFTLRNVFIGNRAALKCVRNCANIVPKAHYYRESGTSLENYNFTDLLELEVRENIHITLFAQAQFTVSGHLSLPKDMFAPPGGMAWILGDIQDNGSDNPLSTALPEQANILINAGQNSVDYQLDLTGIQSILPALRCVKGCGGILPFIHYLDENGAIIFDRTKAKIVEVVAGTTVTLDYQAAAADKAAAGLFLGSIIEVPPDHIGVEGPRMIWRQGRDSLTARGDRVVWGFFHLSPEEAPWGHHDNPEVFVKIWFDAGGQSYVDYCHVSGTGINLSTFYHNTQYLDILATVQRHAGYSFLADGGTDRVLDSAGSSQKGGSVDLPSQTEAFGLRTGASLRTVDGFYSLLQRVGGKALTAENDGVEWGYFYLDPTIENWGSADNPEIMYKLWFDENGTINANFCHFSGGDAVVRSWLVDITHPDAPVNLTEPLEGEIRQGKPGDPEHGPKRYLRHDYQILD